MPNQTFADY